MQIVVWMQRSLVVWLTLVTAALVVPSFADDTSYVGREGTVRFDQNCEGQNLVIGFDYTSGTAMDSVGAVCQVIENGAFTDNFINKGRAGGGGGGDAATIRCPPNQAVAALDVHTDKFRAIRHFQIICFTLGGTEATFVDTRNKGGEDNGGGVASCPPGEFATGIFGGAAAIVDRIGLHCGPIPTAAPVATTPPPPDTTPPPPPPPPPPTGTRTVANATTVYDAPENGNEIGYLNPGDQVTIVGSCGPESMCNISAPNSGYVWSGDLNP